MERRILKEFIELYCNEESLWKVKSCYYHNKTIKNLAYRRLLIKLKELHPEADIAMVKKKINALRTSFKKNLKKVEASRERCKQTGEPVYTPSLWYYDQLHFIVDQESELKNNDVGVSGIDDQDILNVELYKIENFDGKLENYVAGESNLEFAKIEKVESLNEKYNLLLDQTTQLKGALEQCKMVQDEFMKSATTHMHNIVHKLNASTGNNKGLDAVFESTILDKPEKVNSPQEPADTYKSVKRKHTDLLVVSRKVMNTLEMSTSFLNDFTEESPFNGTNLVDGNTKNPRLMNLQGGNDGHKSR